MSTAPRHREMMCRVERIDYDFQLRRAVVHLPPGDCCDMGGCIAAIEKIDRRAREIQTVAGDLPDTAYIRIDGEWHAVAPERFAWRPDPAFEPRSMWERSC